MANTTIKLKRSSVAGKQPNTTSLSTGELAINITDQKIYSSNGTGIFEPAANVTTLYVGNSSVYTTVNSTAFSGVANTANNASYLNSQPASYYTNATNISTGTVNEARLPYRMDQNVRTTDNVTFANVALTRGTVSTAPVSDYDIVNKLYADAIATGINFHPAVRLSTTVTFDVTTATYNNGTSGVNATITDNSPYIALSLDGVSAAYGDRVLMRTASNTAWNGVYVVSNTGSGSYPWIITRAFDYDQIGSGVNEIDQGDLIYVLAGSTLAGTSWVQQNVVTTIGTDGISFVQFSSKTLYPLSVDSNTSLYYSTGSAYDGSAASTLSVNNAYIATLTSNNASYLGGTAASGYQTTAGLSANVATLTANNTSFVGSVSAANVVSNNQLSSNLANYQTTAGLAANVATLSSNNASYLGGVAAASYVNTSGSYTITGVHTYNANLILGTAGISANGTYGAAGQVLTSNSSGTYWSTVTSGGSSSALLQARQQYTGDGTTTTFSVTGGYTANNLDVFVNGTKLRNGTEVTVTNGSTFIISPAPPLGALVDAVGVSTLYTSGVNTLVSQQFTANGTANSFTISGGYVPNYVTVFVNGVKQLPTTDVDVSSGTTINLVVTPASGYVIDVWGYVNPVALQSNVISVGNVSIGLSSITIGNSTINSSINSTASFATFAHMNPNSMSYDYTTTAGLNAVIAGPFTVNTGFTMTITTGSRVVIV